MIAGQDAVTDGAALVTGYSAGRAVETAFAAAAVAAAAAAAYEDYIALQSLELLCLRLAET